jgi:hypothetical protein
MELKNPRIRLKSLDEILAKAKEVIARHRRKFVKKFSRPCPANCSFATLVGNDRVTGCNKCGSHNPEQCKRVESFVAVNTKEELYKEFTALLRDPEALWTDYRDIFIFYWVLGVFDPLSEEGNLDESLIQTIEKRKAANG